MSAAAGTLLGHIASTFTRSAPIRSTWPTACPPCWLERGRFHAAVGRGSGLATWSDGLRASVRIGVRCATTSRQRPLGRRLFRHRRPGPSLAAVMFGRDRPPERLSWGLFPFSVRWPRCAAGGCRPPAIPLRRWTQWDHLAIPAWLPPLRFFAFEPIVPRPGPSGRFSPPCMTGRQATTRAGVGSFIAFCLRRRTGPDARLARGLVGTCVPTALMGFCPSQPCSRRVVAGLWADSTHMPFSVRAIAACLFVAAGSLPVRCQDHPRPPWPIRPGFWAFHHPSRTARSRPPGHDRSFSGALAVADAASALRSLLPWALPLPGLRTPRGAPAGSRHLGRPSASGNCFQSHPPVSLASIPLGLLFGVLRGRRLA